MIPDFISSLHICSTPSWTNGKVKQIALLIFVLSLCSCAQEKLSTAQRIAQIEADIAKKDPDYYAQKQRIEDHVKKYGSSNYQPDEHCPQASPMQG